MAIRKRDMIQDAIKRCLEGRLFVYFDQIDKKEDTNQIFKSHMFRLIDTVKQIVPKHQANNWIVKATTLADTNMKEKKTSKVKEEIKSLFDDDFFDFFDEIAFESVLVVNAVIDTLFFNMPIVEEKSENIFKSSKLESYLEQFMPKDSSIEYENYKE